MLVLFLFPRCRESRPYTDFTSFNFSHLLSKLTFVADLYDIALFARPRTLAH
jgi:hypothetical protein